MSHTKLWYCTACGRIGIQLFRQKACRLNAVELPSTDAIAFNKALRACWGSPKDCMFKGTMRLRPWIDYGDRA